MSGTSYDGIDVAWLKSDGQDKLTLMDGAFYPFAQSLRDELHKAMLRAHLYAAPPSSDKDFFCALEDKFTHAHLEALRDFTGRQKKDMGDWDIIGFHGQTLRHAPQQGWCWQIGDGAYLAQETQCVVVNQFRANDLAHGGGGAPLVPLFHHAYGMKQNIAMPFFVVNIGGVSNVTLCHGTHIHATDSGIGMAWLDDLCAPHHINHQKRDALIQQGALRPFIIADYLACEFFSREMWRKPQSLDRHEFQHIFASLREMALRDALASSMQCVAQGIALILQKARHVFGIKAARVILCGGGRHCAPLVHELKKRESDVILCDDIGWRGDLIEAYAFAWLAVRAFYGLPLSLPTTTGVTKPVSGGIIHTCSASSIGI